MSEKRDDVDECNFYNVPGEEPRYIVRPPELVDENTDYCATGIDDETTNWNYILGCFRGDLTKAKILDSAEATLPPDCVEVGYESFAGILTGS